MVFLMVLVVPIFIRPARIAMGKTKRRLVIFEPMRLPTAKGKSWLAAAVRDTANSGREVPRATKVVPMIRGERRRAVESWLESFTNSCEQTKIRTSETTKTI